MLTNIYRNFAAVLPPFISKLDGHFGCHIGNTPYPLPSLPKKRVLIKKRSFTTKTNSIVATRY